MYEAQARRILMIDEDQPVLDVTKDWFKRFLNTQFFMMNHPRIGIQVAALRLPELLITEIFFPRTENFDGEYLIRAIKEFCPDIKIIVCSSIDDEQVIEGYILKNGVDAYLKKPFDLSLLVAKATELLNEPCPFAL